MCGREPILGVTSDLFLCLSLRQWFRRFQHCFLLFRMRLRCFQKKDGKCSSADMVSESHRHFFIFGCFACSFSSLIAPASIGQVYHVAITFAAVYARLRFFSNLFSHTLHTTHYVLLNRIVFVMGIYAMQSHYKKHPEIFSTANMADTS